MQTEASPSRGREFSRTKPASSDRLPINLQDRLETALTRLHDSIQHDADDVAVIKGKLGIIKDLLAEGGLKPEELKLEDITIDPTIFKAYKKLVELPRLAA